MTKSTRFVTFFALAAALACAQSRPAATTPVVNINGKVLTAGGLRDLLRNAPGDFLSRLSEDPRDTFISYALTRQLADEARAAGLDKKFPYAQRIEWESMGALMNVQLAAILDAIEIPETEIRAYYTAHVAEYRTMQATVIRVKFDNAGGPDKAKTLAEDIVRRARNGESFADLGKRYSSEPELALKANANTITPSFDLPPAAKEKLFATLPSQVTDPIQMVDSYVIFRVEEFKARPLAEVRNDIKGELQQQRSGSELEKIRSQITVKVLMPQFFAANAPNPLPGAPRADSFDPKAAVAEINGKQVTAQEMNESLQGMAPTARQAAATQTQEFLIQYETLKRLAKAAREAGLDKKPPASDHIFWSSDRNLMQGQLDEKTKSIVSSLEEQQNYYKANIDKFKVAQTKLIYVPYSLTPPPGSNARSEQAALARAMEARKKAEAGNDFVMLVRDYSEDLDSKSRNGDMGLRFADPNIPPTVRDAVFSAKNGAIAGPIRLNNGMYLFQVKENKVLDFEEVRNDIYNVLSDEKFKVWFDETRGKIKVEILNADAIKAELSFH